MFIMLLAIRMIIIVTVVIPATMITSIIHAQDWLPMPIFGPVLQVNIEALIMPKPEFIIVRDKPLPMLTAWDVSKIINRLI